MVTIIIPERKRPFHGPKRDPFFSKMRPKRKSKEAKKEGDTQYFDFNKILWRVEAPVHKMKLSNSYF